MQNNKQGINILHFSVSCKIFTLWEPRKYTVNSVHGILYILDHFYCLYLDHSTPRSPAKRARTQLQFFSPVEESILKSNCSNSEKVLVDESRTSPVSTLNESLHNLRLTSLNKNYSTYGGDPFVDGSSSSGSSVSETDSGSESSYRYSLPYF